MSASQGVMRIGEVHAQLRKDFPDVELSKIRYYEDKGLVRPSRSRKGYRLYSERDVACLREAIRLAHEEFVPLRVVRLRLIEQGLLVDAEVMTTTRRAARESSVASVSALAPKPALAPVPPVSSDSEVPESVTVHELLAASGLTSEEFNQLQALGLVAPLVIDGVTRYGSLDVRIASLAQALFARGVDARILGSLRRIAERNVGVVDEATRALRHGPRALSSDQVIELVETVAYEVTQLCTALVERELKAHLRS